jgi:hypothetical protein
MLLMAIRKSLFRNCSGIKRITISITVVILFVCSSIGCVSSFITMNSNPANNQLINIEGVYECTSKTYKGLTSITKLGEIYYLNWKIGKQSYRGVGIRENNILSASWTNGKGIIGIVVYKIESGPRLSGKYSFQPGKNIIGTEILTFKDSLTQPPLLIL